MKTNWQYFNMRSGEGGRIISYLITNFLFLIGYGQNPMIILKVGSRFKIHFVLKDKKLFSLTRDNVKCWLGENEDPVIGGNSFPC